MKTEIDLTEEQFEKEKKQLELDQLRKKEKWIAEVKRFNIRGHLEEKYNPPPKIGFWTRFFKLFGHG